MARRAKKVAPPPATLAEAVRDVRSEAWSAMLDAASAPEVDALLEGVRWAQRKSYEPGELAPNAAFTGRGAAGRAMRWRLIQVVARGAGETARALRDQITSLSVTGAAEDTLDLGALASLRALAWLRVHTALGCVGLTGIAHAAHVELLAIANVDPTPLAAVPQLMLSKRSDAPMTVASTRAMTNDQLALAGVALPETRFGDAREVGILPPEGLEALGPIEGGPRVLRIYNAPRSFRALSLGELPRLEELRTSGVRSLERIDGLERQTTLRTVVLADTALDAMPALPAGVTTLTLHGRALDVSGLATLPALRELRLRATERMEGLEAIGELAGLELLEVAPPASLPELLRVLPKLGALRELSLAGHELERVPALDRLAPSVEVLSLVRCRGFLEHDVLARMPALRTLHLRGSTLDTYKRQIEPKLRARGVELDFERAW